MMDSWAGSAPVPREKVRRVVRIPFRPEFELVVEAVATSAQMGDIKRSLEGRTNRALAQAFRFAADELDRLADEANEQEETEESE